jgi:hypothetical protein
MPIMPRVWMLAVAGVIVAGGCATSVAGSQQIRRTAEGGTYLVTGGSNLSAAMKATQNGIERHCRGEYEVTEVARTDTGASIGSGSAFTYYGVTSASGSSTKLFGTGVTYLCRKPTNSDLNVWLAEAASADLLGKKCERTSDCGPFPCGIAARNSNSTVCTLADGTLPFSGLGGPCERDADCLDQLRCRTAVQNYCAPK